MGSLASAAGAAVAGCQIPGQRERETDRSTPEATPTETPVSPPDGDDGSYADVYEAVSSSVASVNIYDRRGRGAQGTAFVYEDT